MIYQFVNEALLNSLDLRVIQTDFTVKNMEQDESSVLAPCDYSIRQWRTWSGDKITYHFNDNFRNIDGSRGKTTWYIPALNEVSSHILQIPIGQALKIVKYMVKNDVIDEYDRLKKEMVIQNKLAALGHAPSAYEIVVVKNRAANFVIWFGHLYKHRENSVYLTTVVEHVFPSILPKKVISIDEKHNFHGKLVDELLLACAEINLVPYDIGLGNVIYKDGKLFVVDFHSWEKTP